MTLFKCDNENSKFKRQHQFEVTRILHDNHGMPTNICIALVNNNN